MSGAAGQMGFRTRLASLDWRTIDFRAIAAPIAIASPLALIISAQEPVMVTVALLFLAHSWREREWSWLRSGWLLPLLALFAVHGRRPVSSSKRSTPSENKSARESTLPPRQIP